MRNKILVLIFTVLSVVPAFAEGTAADAGRLYKEGKYAEAASVYNSIIEKEGFSAELLYNLGNTYVKAGDVGNAVICYEKALKLDPNDSRIKNNLAYVNSKVADSNRANLKNKKLKVEADEMSFFQQLKYYFSKSHTSDSWAVLGVISFLILIGCLSLYIFSADVLVRKIGFFGAMVFFIASVAFVSIACTASSSMKSHDEGVVMVYKTPLLADPEVGASESSSSLSKGTKLQILDTEKTGDGKVIWYKVRLNSDYVGWIQAKDFVVI